MIVFNVHILLGMTPPLWTLTSVVDVNAYGSLVAHRDLNAVAVTAAQPAFKVFDAQGSVIGTLVNPLGTTLPERELALTRDGQLTHYEASERFMPRHGQRNETGTSTFRVELGRAPLARTYLISVAGRGRIDRSRSWNEVFFVPDPSKVATLIASSWDVRLVRPWSSIGAYTISVDSIRALPSSKVAAILRMNKKGGNDAVFRLPGLSFHGENSYQDYFYSPGTFYLGVIDALSGSTCIVAGFFGLDQSLRSSGSRTFEVFNRGHSIAIKHLNKVYIFSDSLKPSVSMDRGQI